LLRYEGRLTGHGLRHEMRIIVRKVLTALGLKHSWRIAIKMRYVEPITMRNILKVDEK
jgi:hypothetical protein